MTKNSIKTNEELSNLIVIRNNVNEQGKLININILEEKSKVLLPPPQEKYLKVKKHDFL